MTRKFEAIISVLDKASTPLLAIEDRMRQLGQKAKKTEVEIKEIGAGSVLRARISQDIHAIGQRLHHLTHGIAAPVERMGEHFHGAFERAAKGAEKLVEVLPVIGSFAGLGSIAGLAELTNRTAESVEALENQSKVTGLSTRNLQQLNFAAKATSIPVDALTLALERMTMRIGQAAQGRDKNLVGLLAHLHIPLRNAHGQVNSLSVILPKLNVALAGIKDPTIRAADAQLLLGRSSAKLLPLLGMQPAKLEALRQKMDQLGYSYSKADKEGLSKFHNSMNDLDFAIGGFTDDIAATLAPALAPGVEMLAKFVANNRALIAGDLRSGIQWLEHKISHFDWAGFEARAGKAFGTIEKSAGIVLHVLERIDALFPSDHKIESRIARAGHLKDAPISTGNYSGLPSGLRSHPALAIPGARPSGAVPGWMTPGPRPGGRGDMPAPAAPRDGQVHVTFSFKNAPAGMSATSKATGIARVPRASHGQNGTILQDFDR